MPFTLTIDLPILGLIPLLLLPMLLLLLYRQQQRLQSLQHHLDTQAACIAGLQQQLEALLSCSRGMGRRVQRHEKRLRHLTHRQDEVQTLGPGDTPYHHAQALLQQGADRHVLVNDCGLTPVEAELMAKLHPLH